MIQNDSLPPLGFWEDSLDRVEGTVRSGETFSGLMVRLGMDDAAAYALAASLDTVFDVRKMRAGNHWHAYYSLDTIFHRLEYVVYENDRVTRTVFRCADSLAAWRVVKPVEHQLKYADVTIRTSLWNDMVAAGAPTYLISQLSEVYAWTVNFFGLQKEDRFRVLYGQTVCEGEVIDVDTLYYAVYSSGGKDFPAILFDQGEGGNRYWNTQGESLRKAFLSMVEMSCPPMTMLPPMGLERPMIWRRRVDLPQPEPPRITETAPPGRTPLTSVSTLRSP